MRLKSTIYESTLSTASRRFFIKGRCPKVVFKSWVTSHNNDTSRPLEKGRAEGAG